MSLPAAQLARLVHRGAPAASADLAGDPAASPGGFGSRPRTRPGHSTLALDASLGRCLERGTRIDAALPDGGLPRGAVVEIASAFGLARATSVAIAACAAAQEASITWAAGAAWCAWIDPWCSLHAPGVRAGGVTLERLLVVRPPLASLARTAVRVAASQVFAVVVVDMVSPLDGSVVDGSVVGGAGVGGEVRLERWPTVTRRLALSVEGTETTVILLTDLTAHRALPLPVAMRIELERRPDRDGIARGFVRIAKERHGRVGGAVPLVEDGLRPPLRSATSRG